MFDSDIKVERKLTTPGTSHASEPSRSSNARHRFGAYSMGATAAASMKTRWHQSSMISESSSSSWVNEKKPARSLGALEDIRHLSSGQEQPCRPSGSTRPTHSASRMSVTLSFSVTRTSRSCSRSCRVDPIARDLSPPPAAPDSGGDRVLCARTLHLQFLLAETQLSSLTSHLLKPLNYI